MFPLVIFAQTDDPRDFEKITYTTDCTDQGGKCMFSDPTLECDLIRNTNQCAVGLWCCRQTSPIEKNAGGGSVGAGTSGSNTQNPNAKPNGSGESRLWFSGLKEVAAMSKMLQSIFAPNIKEKVKADDPEFVTTKINKHQGIDDNIKVVNTKDNNSSLIQDKPAPSPLYDYGGSDPYSSDSLCTIEETRANAGDNLAGPKIKARLTYTQKFEYMAKTKDGCIFDENLMDPDRDKCCSGSYSSTEVQVANKKIVVNRCDKAKKVPDDSKGRVAVFSKTPLIEYISDALLFGSMSVYRAIMPAPFTKDIKEIPSKVEYTAEGGDRLKVGDGSPTRPLLYIPRVGSLKEYFLDTLQTALRPIGFGNVKSLLVPKNNNIDQSRACYVVAKEKPPKAKCDTPADKLTLNQPCAINPEMQKIIEDAGSSAGVPPDLLAAVISIETRNTAFDIDSTVVKTHNESKNDTDYKAVFCEPSIDGCGSFGVMQLLTGYGYNDDCPSPIAKNIDNWTSYSCQSPDHGPANPGNIRDSIFSGARMLKDLSGTSLSNNKNWSKKILDAVGAAYHSNCTAKYQLGTTLNQVNSCILGYHPLESNASLSYCEFLWNYYAPRNGLSPAPVVDNRNQYD